MKYGLTVLQEEGFNQTITILNAPELKNQLYKTGKAVLYINFDTDKSSLTTEGVRAVEEIAKVLQQDTSLRLSIEGHTDDSGVAAYNKSLSTKRANSVLKQLVELTINDDRLRASGYGSDKPLVANDTEVNKAKNRRVELVKL